MRKDELTIEQAKMLALNDDHAEQDSVWFERDHWNRQPQNLRLILTREHVTSRDRLAAVSGLRLTRPQAAGSSATCLPRTAPRA